MRKLLYSLRFFKVVLGAGSLDSSIILQKSTERKRPFPKNTFHSTKCSVSFSLGRLRVRMEIGGVLGLDRAAIFPADAQNRPVNKGAGFSIQVLNEAHMDEIAPLNPQETLGIQHLLNMCNGVPCKVIAEAYVDAGLFAEGLQVTDMFLADLNFVSCDDDLQKPALWSGRFVDTARHRFA